MGPSPASSRPGNGFARARQIDFAATLGMVEYSSALAAFLPALFPPVVLAGTLVLLLGLSSLAGGMWILARAEWRIARAGADLAVTDKYSGEVATNHQAVVDGFEQFEASWISIEACKTSGKGLPGLDAIDKGQKFIRRHEISEPVELL